MGAPLGPLSLVRPAGRGQLERRGRSASNVAGRAASQQRLIMTRRQAVPGTDGPEVLRRDRLARLDVGDEVERPAMHDADVFHGRALIAHSAERGPRGVYTGAIGWFGPDGNACFNVAIRTLLARGKRFTFGVGGGITVDSNAADEFRECRLKAAFLKASTTSC